MSLNGRIYYEIKRRYKSVLLQRHSTKIGSTTNSSSMTRRIALKKLPSNTALTMTLCDSERYYGSTAGNYAEHESVIISQITQKFPTFKRRESIVRINFREKKNRRMRSSSPTSLKTIHSYSDQNHCIKVSLGKYFLRIIINHLFFLHCRTIYGLGDVLNKEIHLLSDQSHHRIQTIFLITRCLDDVLSRMKI